MKIIGQNNENLSEVCTLTISFKEVQVGQVFLKDNEFYLKTRNACDYQFNAFCLSNNVAVFIPNEHVRVELAETELHVKNSNKLSIFRKVSTCSAVSSETAS